MQFVLFVLIGRNSSNRIPTHVRLVSAAVATVPRNEI